MWLAFKMFRLQTHRVSRDHLGSLALADVVGLHSALAVHHQVQDEDIGLLYRVHMRLKIKLFMTSTLMNGHDDGDDEG